MTAAASTARPRVNVVTPAQVSTIVASDTAINNSANASLSIPLQDSHETCLQSTLDDATFRGDLASGASTLGGSFNQVPTESFVPRQQSYPAFFSVLAADTSSGQPTTHSLLSYVKATPSAHWKLASSSAILGPTVAGVAVPAALRDATGYATMLATATPDGLITPPGTVGSRVAAAFTAQARTGVLPPGISAQFGSKNAASPHSIAASFSGLGATTVSYSTVAPALAAGGLASSACAYPAFRLANGGALVTFAVFAKVVVTVPSGSAVVQPSSRSAFGGLLAPGIYSSLTITFGDMGVAVVPPAGSHSPIEVLGQESEELSAAGAVSSGSSNPTGVGGPSNAAAIATRVDPALVDINTVLDYGTAKAAGTGMVLTKSGEILTNNHVIEGATTINVTDIGNQQTYTARVVGYDRSRDVAVLQLVHASGLSTVQLADSSTVRTGQAVVGIGNAGGSGGTPSFSGGRVTALDQSITASDAADGSSEQLTGLIETNADIQPGDSGGPLVNSAGKVIGIDTAASGGFSFLQGTSQGFSIPINSALQVAHAITAGKASTSIHIGATAYLGVSVLSTSSGSFGGFGQPILTPSSSGALVQSVASGSPAAKAGLAAGDVITSLAGRTVASSSSLTTILTSEKPGGSARLVYLDPAGASHIVSVTFAAGPPQ